jgi:hypothetical protein
MGRSSKKNKKALKKTEQAVKSAVNLEAPRRKYSDFLSPEDRNRFGLK